MFVKATYKFLQYALIFALVAIAIPARWLEPDAAHPSSITVRNTVPAPDNFYVVGVILTFDGF